VLKRGLNFSLIGLFILLGVIAAPTLAQNMPDAVLERAISAAQTALNTTERPANWRWEFLGERPTSALGCATATGETLAQPVSVYRVILTLSSGVYAVHVSADAQFVQLCDEKFSAVISATPSVSTGSQVSCTLSPVATATLYELPSTTSATVQSVQADAELVAYGRTSDGVWYEVAVDGRQGIAWVQSSSVSAAEDCQGLPVSASVVDVAGAACFLSPASTFSNVRSQPSTDSAQVSEIYENSAWQVIATNEDRSWFFIEPGWVAAQVATLRGECDTIPVNVDFVGSGLSPSESVPPVAGEPVTTIPQEAVCPSQFTGYLPARIQIGQQTAQVADGGLPNRLREAPSTQAVQVGLAQPGRVLDRVVNGPACTDGFVWWLVEIDGVSGWTAESSFSEDRYFLEPVGQAAVPTPVFTPQPVTTLEADTVPPLAAFDFEGFAWKLAVDATGEIVAVLEWAELTDETDEISDTIYLLDVPTEPTADTESLLIAEIEWDAVADLLISPDGMTTLLEEEGSITLINAAGTETGDVIDDVPQYAEESLLGAYNSSGSLLLVTTCDQFDAEDLCTRGRIDLWDAVDGQLIRQQPAHPETPLALFSPDDSVIASGASDGVQVWDVQSGAFLGAIGSAPDELIFDMAFNPSGTLLIYGTCALDDADTCVSGDVVVLDPADLLEIDRIGDHSGAVTSVAFSPDGALWASHGDDGLLLVYDVASGSPVATIETGLVDADIAFVGEMGQTLAVVGAPFDTETGSALRFYPVGG